MRDKSEEPILERIKSIVPPVDDVARALQAEHLATKRVHALLLLTHAAIAEMGEILNQTMGDNEASIATSASLMSSQSANMMAMEKFADDNAGARTVIMNLKVWLAEDEASIKDILEFVNLVHVTGAAREMTEVRVRELIDALEARNW